MWTLTQKTEKMLYTFEREILRRIYGPMQDNGLCVLDGIVKFIIYTNISISWKILKLEDWDWQVI
jgi:hypothetical protein